MIALLPPSPLFAFVRFRCGGLGGAGVSGFDHDGSWYAQDEWQVEWRSEVNRIRRNVISKV